jgi:hypothetical protein
MKEKENRNENMQSHGTSQVRKSKRRAEKETRKSLKSSKKTKKIKKIKKMQMKMKWNRLTKLHYFNKETTTRKKQPN